MRDNQDVIAIYSRKSRFTGKGESVGNQVDMCRAYIGNTFGSDHAEKALVFEDEGFSGGNLNRPDFKRMMKGAREHKFHAIVVYRLDRISRNISDFAALITELNELGVDFISIRESFDTTSPMGRAMMYIASVFSQLERETIAERIRDNMHELAKTGRWLGGTTPTGYTSESIQTVTVDGKKKKVCHLKLIPEEAEVVRQIFHLYMETDSLTATEAELLRQHVKTKTGCAYTRFSIKGILQNPVYLVADRHAYQYFADHQADLCSNPEAFDGSRGILAYNRTDQKKGRSTIYLPTSRWIVSVGQHPGIIPSKSWIAVQQSLERNKSGAYRKTRCNEALLTGVLWCTCGNRMYPKLSTRVGEDGKPVYTYICKMKEHSKGRLCKQKNVRGDVLDAVVIEQISWLRQEDYCFFQRLEQCMGAVTELDGREAALKKLDHQQSEIQRKINGLVDSLADFQDSIAQEHLKERIEVLHIQREGVESDIHALKKEEMQGVLCDSEFERLSQRLSSFSCSVEDMSVEEKRNVIRALVHKVVWDGQSAQVFLAGAEEMVLEGEEN